MSDPVVHRWSGLAFDCTCGFSGNDFNHLMAHFQEVTYRTLED